jgi:hypothetical protein
MRFRRGFGQNIPARAGNFAIPTLEAFDGAPTTGNTITLTGSLAGDLLIGVNSSSTTSVPLGPAGTTSLGSGIASDETTDLSIRCSWKIAAGADEVIPAAGSSRATWLALRGVDTTNFAALMSEGTTFVYGATTGANMVIPALGALPRPGVVLVLGKQLAANTIAPAAGMTLVDVQNSGSGEAFSWWSGATNVLDSLGTLLPSYAGQTTALGTGTSGRAAMSIWIPGAPL